MLDVTSSWCAQAPSTTARPTSTPAMRKERVLSTGSLAVIVLSSSASVGDKAVGAAIILRRLDTTWHAVDPVDAAQQIRLRIRSGGKSVIRPRQVLLRDGPNDEGCHDHHQLGLVVDEIPAAEQRPENRQCRQAGQSVDRLLGLVLDQAGHRHRTA